MRPVKNLMQHKCYMTVDGQFWINFINAIKRVNSSPNSIKTPSTLKINKSNKINKIKQVKTSWFPVKASRVAYRWSLLIKKKHCIPSKSLDSWLYVTPPWLAKRQRCDTHAYWLNLTEGFWLASFHPRDLSPPVDLSIAASCKQWMCDVLQELNCPWTLWQISHWDMTRMKTRWQKDAGC